MTGPGRETARVAAAYERRSGLTNHYSFFTHAHRYQLPARERTVLDLLRHDGVTDLAGLRILDVGCGTSQWLLDLLRWCASPDLVGIDLNADRVTVARRRVPASVQVTAADGSRRQFLRSHTVGLACKEECR